MFPIMLRYNIYIYNIYLENSIIRKIASLKISKCLNNVNYYESSYELFYD